MNRVAVTGIGVISALGHDPAAMRAALKSGRSAIGPLTIRALQISIGARQDGARHLSSATVSVLQTYLNSH